MSRKYTINILVLVTPTSKVDVLDRGVDVKIFKRTLRATTTNLIPVDSFDKQNWRSSL